METGQHNFTICCDNRFGAAIFGHQLIYLQLIERKAEQTQAALSSFEQQILQELDTAIPMTERSVMELSEELKTQNLSIQEGCVTL